MSSIDICVFQYLLRDTWIMMMFTHMGYRTIFDNFSWRSNDHENKMGVSQWYLELTGHNRHFTVSFVCLLECLCICYSMLKPNFVFMSSRFYWLYLFLEERLFAFSTKPNQLVRLSSKGWSRFNDDSKKTVDILSFDFMHNHVFISIAGIQIVVVVGKYSITVDCACANETICCYK